MSISNSVLTAQQGTFIVNNTAARTVDHDAIIVLEDTVFSAIRVAGVDVKSSYIAAPGTAVKAGAIIRPLNDKKFSGVTLTSGSVCLVL